MVDTRTTIEKRPENPRTAIREERQRRLRLVAGKTSSVKVYAADETMRGSLRHANGVRFRSKIDQPVEWPNDSFTQRRIADGSVRTDGPGSGEAAEPDESLNPREQAAARKAGPAKAEAKAPAKPLAPPMN